MSQPVLWTPLPNPGGQGRRFMRTILQQHLTGLHIPGVDKIYRGMPVELVYDTAAGSLYACLVGLHIADISETRGAQTGPADPGGKDAHYTTTIYMWHRAFAGDETGPGGWEEAEDDHDRILDALKDGLRGANRDLGRPDVVMQAGEWPREGSITSATQEPYFNAGVRDQWSTITFTITQYMQRQP